MSTTPEGSVLTGRAIRKVFGKAPAFTVALDGIDLEVRAGSLTALVGPDGAGKTTMLRLATGLILRDGGELSVLGIDPSVRPQEIQDRISYMPQRFGLYEDLTVKENLDLYADLHGVSTAARLERYPQLMQLTQLSPFVGRLAGRLSGGMKQKLGLACTLVRSPELLLLDEPTVGVDPLSRRELWDIIHHLVKTERLTVLMSTSYLDEAERCDHVLVLHRGQVLARGVPSDIAQLAARRTFLIRPAANSAARSLQARLLDDTCVLDAVPDGGRVRLVLDSNVTLDALLTPMEHADAVDPCFEDGFMVLLRQSVAEKQAGTLKLARPLAANAQDIVIKVHDLVRTFGAFTAVDHVSFTVQRGEIFGLLGPNGAGKTTTFRMLCGLLPASGGELRIAGADLRRAGAAARQRIGYVAQKFSLYGALSVCENLEFFASAYGLTGDRKRERIDWALEQFELEQQRNIQSSQLPGGYKQRLAMSAALLHEPEILFLDEPTSGADPLARRAFWRRITALAEQGVTVIVTTHFMQEAEYCDRLVIMDSGKVLARGSPGEIRTGAAQDGSSLSMESAFIAIVEAARQSPSNQALAAPRPSAAAA